MSKCDWDLQISDAHKTCEQVKIKWPVKSQVAWLPRNADNERWTVTPWAGAGAPVGGKGTVLSDTQLLSELKEKLIAEAYAHFNVCQSVPKYDSNVIDQVKWPGNLCGVRNVWISPTCCLKDALTEVIKEVQDLWRDESLILHGFPLNSGFALNVLYIIGSLFEKVGFIYPEDLHATFIFFEFSKDVSCQDLLMQVLSAMKTNDPSSLSVNPNSKFYGSKFYKYSKKVNCILIKEEILDIIKNVETSETDEVLAELQGPCQSLQCLSKHHSRCSIFCTRLHDQLDHLSFYVQQIRIPQNETTFSWQYPSEKGCPAIEIVKRLTVSTDISKFCLKQLLSCHRRICLIFKYSLNLTEEEIREKSCLSRDSNIVTSMKKYPWADSVFEVNILDFGKELWLNTDHTNYQGEILRRIIIVLEDMWINECLELRGFPLLSEFNISVVFLLAHLFEKMRFFHSHRGRNSIFFYNYQTVPANVKRHLETTLLRENCNSLQSIVKLQKIYSAEFYERVRDFNNVILKEQCLCMLKTLSVEIDAVGTE